MSCPVCEGTGLLWPGHLTDVCPLCDDFVNREEESEERKSSMAAANVSSSGEGVDSSMKRCPQIKPKLYEVADVDAWRLALQSDGYVVLKDFLAPTRRAELLDSCWAELGTKYPKVVREIPDTWPRGKLFSKEEFFRPNADFIWDLRTEPSVAEVFSAVHQVASNELCVSIDNYSLLTRGRSKDGLPLHVDQAADRDERSKMLCVQGAYNFFEVGPEDLGLVVVPRSHRRWGRDGGIGKERPGAKDHFVMMQANDADWVWAHQQKTKLLIPQNSFVLWDSRTVHGTAPATSDRDTPTGELPSPNRLTVFVSMMPRALRTLKVRQEKIELYRSGGFTSHWANYSDNNRDDISFEEQPGRLTENGEIPPERLAML